VISTSVIYSFEEMYGSIMRDVLHTLIEYGII